jgi:hypothetical protein
MIRADISIHSSQLPRVVSQNGVSVREDVAYTNHKGEENSGVRKRTDKALGKLHEVLASLLEKDESVLYLARARAPQSGLEQALANLYTYYMTTSVLIFTNRRMIHFLVKSDGTWRRSIRCVAWGDVAESKIKGSFLGRTLTLRYRNGKKETYTALRGGDGKKIKTLVEAIFASGSLDPTAAQGIVSLCPNCRTVLTPSIYQCAQCQLIFKNELTAARRTILIPGGGYFYVGMPLPGIVFALVESLFLLSIILVGIGSLLGGPQTNREEPSAWIALLPIFVFLALDKLVTYLHVRNMVRNFIPAG